jgi:hypothetical protein
MTPLNDLSPQLRNAAARLGYTVESIAPGTTRFTKDGGSKKWMLGGRTINLRASCQANEATGTLAFREMRAESSWGVPPPAITVERDGVRSDLARALDAAAVAAGWRFVAESGKPPV